jgi:hypothetical protein
MHSARKEAWIPILLVMTLTAVCLSGQLAVSSAAPGEVAATATQSLGPLMTAAHEVFGTPTRTVPIGTPAAEVSLDATFEDADGFFSLDYPQGWIISPKGGALLAPTGGGGLSMSIEIKAVSPQSLADRYAAWYADQVDNYRKIGRQEETLSGYPAVWVDQVFSSDGAPYRGFMAVTVRNRVGFVFTGWAPEERYATLVPTLRAMVHSVRIAEFEESPPYDKWLTFSTNHLVFHYLPDTWVVSEIKGIAIEHETAFTDNVELLEVDYEGPIDVYLYTSEESFYRATARDAGFAINEASEVHTRWFAEDDHQTPGHEITHVITYHAIGQPSEALLGEGIAVWLDHAGNDYHRLCAKLRAEDQLVPLADFLGDGWDGSAAAYYEAGSFVGFLLETYGVDKFKKVFTAADLDTALKKAYRADLAALERKWIETLK